MDDEDLLLDWSAGDLPAERHEQLLDHLAACPACRREIAAMVRAGALVLPDVEASLRDENPGVGETEPRGAWQRPAMFALVTALAASLLLVLARGVFDFEPADGGSVIAMAQRDLDQGRPGEAFARLETYLSGGPDVAEDQRVRAAAILESSGYQLARGGLVQGDFSRVSDIEHRVSRHSGGSSRLLNLRIQAERGETSERSLAARMSLLEHYDYELDGRQVIKSLTIRAITDTDRRIEAGLQAAIAAYPDELDLRLNYGQLLLDQRHFERAEAEFAAAVAADPQNALAHTGLGLAILEQADDEDDRQTAARALPHFQNAARLAPDDPVMQQNLTICRNRLSLNAQP
jgi:tetratricopeptide (TPR) repeat protein